MSNFYTWAFTPTSPGCDEAEGAFIGGLSSTAKDAIMEDEYEMSCRVRQSQTLWELPSTAGATDPALTLLSSQGPSGGEEGV